MDDKKLLGYKISHTREMRNMTQQQLADRIGTSRENIARYETGKNEPRAFMIRDICKVLHVSVDYLLGLSEVRYRR